MRGISWSVEERLAFQKRLGFKELIARHWMIYDIFVKLQLGCHPVAVVQYTFTHKQYTERHKTNNT